MNNSGLNREQFNDVIKKRTFYSVIERLFPFRKINYPTSKRVDYYKPNKIPYPVAKELIKE